MERIVHQDVHPLPLPLAQRQAWTSSSSSCLRRPCSLPARNQRPCSSAQQDDHRWLGGRAAGFPVRHNPSLFPGHVASRRDGAAGWAHHKHQKHSLDQVSFDHETLFRLFGLLFFLQIPFSRVQQFTTKEMRLSLFNHLHRLGVRWHNARKTGEVLRVMDRGTSSITTVLNAAFFQVALHSFSIKIPVS